MGNEAVVNLATLHYGEEPVISGTRGSGTVFFEGCSLGCIFCQNRKISRGATGHGKTLTPEKLSEVFLDLAGKGAHNINLVTPMHFAPSVAQALTIAKDRGLTVPVVVNCGGYESVDALKLLDGLVDIYLPDLKFFSSKLSREYAWAPDYFEKACAAIDEMYRQTGPLELGDDGMLKRGMIVRHLMLPGQLFDTRKILDHLTSRYGNTIYISLMDQYTPVVPDLPDALNRRVPEGHYRAAVDYLLLTGQENAFIQEGGSGEEMIPEFK